MFRLRLVAVAFLVFVVLSVLGCQSAISSSGLIGKWEQTTRNGQAAIPAYTYVFNGDGTFILNAVGAGMVSGTYTILDNGYIRTSANGASVTQSYVVNKDVLTMSNGGATSIYQRVK